MGRIVQGDDDLENDERAPATLITLPDELRELIEHNQELVERVLGALSDTYSTLTEEQLWDVIAAASSPQWKQARMELDGAEACWADLNKPDNMPLGSIGEALDSDMTTSVKKDVTVKLSEFKIYDEGLRQREDLKKLLGVLLVLQRMVDRSAEITRQVQKSTVRLAEHLAYSIRDDFRAASRRPSHLRKQFGKIAQRAQNLLKPEKKNEEAATNVIALLSPKT